MAVEWTVIKEFEEEGICVEVRELALYVPRFSFCIGVKRPDGFLLRHLPLKVETDPNSPTPDEPVGIVTISDIITKLSQKAEEFVTDRLLEMRKSGGYSAERSSRNNRPTQTYSESNGKRTPEEFTRDNQLPQKPPQRRRRFRKEREDVDSD